MAASDEALPPSRIDWRRNLYALWIAQLMTIVGFSMRTPFLPFFLEDIGASDFSSQALWAGVINAGGAIVMAISAPIWGIVADRRGRKLMVLRAMFMASFTVGLMSLATSPWHLLGLRFIEGGFTGTVGASTTLIASTTPRRNRAFALGMMQTAVFSGSSAGPLIGGVLADLIGYRPTFVVAGLLIFASAVIVLTQVREDFTPPEPAKPGEDNGPTTRSLLFGAAMLAMVGVMFALRAGNSAIQPIMPLFVEQLSGNGSAATLSGIVLGIAGLTSAVSAVTLGRMADRVGHRRILIPTALATAILYLPMAAAQAPWQLIIISALVGIAAGGVTPSANAVISNLTPAARRGAIFGFTSAVTAMGGFVGPLGGAAIAAVFNIRLTFIVVSGLMALGAIGVLLAIRSGVDLDAEGEE
ncbi:MAG TPA: MFS transporter [Thermomicrobiales bacterium]|nr:MFS transporter [Thermomicrobiales bacterium]